MNRKSKQLLAIALSGALTFSTLGAAKADDKKPMNNHQLLIVLQQMSKSRAAKRFSLISQRCKKVAQTSKIIPFKSDNLSSEDRKKDYELFTGVETLRTDFHDPSIVLEDEPEDSTQTTQDDAYVRAKRFEYKNDAFTADDFQQQLDSLVLYSEEAYINQNNESSVEVKNQVVDEKEEKFVTTTKDQVADEKEEKSVTTTKDQVADEKEEKSVTATKDQSVDAKEEKSIVKEKDQPSVAGKGKSTKEKQNKFVNVKVEVFSPLHVRVTLRPDKVLGLKTEIFDMRAEYADPRSFYDFISKVRSLCENKPERFIVEVKYKCKIPKNELCSQNLINSDDSLPILPVEYYHRDVMQTYISKYEDVVCKYFPKKSILWKKVTVENGDVANGEWFTFKNGKPYLDGEVINPKDITDVVVTGDIYYIETNRDMFTTCTRIKKIDLSKDEITCIKSRTFTNNIHLKEVKFPKTLTRILDRAFEGCDIEKLELGKTKVFIIETEAFKNNNNLKEVKFPKTLTRILSGAFQNCNIQELDLSQTKLYSVDVFAFAHNQKLKNVKFPATLMAISDFAFYDCDIEGVLDLSNTELSVIDNGAFKGNFDLKVVKLPVRMHEYINQTPFAKTGIFKDAFETDVKFQIGDTEPVTWDKLPDNLKGIDGIFDHQPHNPVG